MGVLKGLALSEREPSAKWLNCSVYSFASSSRPGLKHFTVLTYDDEIFCTCEGYRVHESCWHKDWVEKHGN